VTPGSAAEVKCLQEKLKQAELRSAELRNHIQSLKNDLKLMQKVSLIFVYIIQAAYGRFCSTVWGFSCVYMEFAVAGFMPQPVSWLPCRWFHHWNEL